MKKILSFIFMVALIGSLAAQERSVNLLGYGKVLDLKTTKNVPYNGGGSDQLIGTTRDTIDYYVILSNYEQGHPINFKALITLEPITTADTTVSIGVYQKTFTAESYSALIAPAATSQITTETTVSKTTLGVTNQITYTTASATDIIRQIVTTDSDTVTVAARTTTVLNNASLYYKYLMFRLIIAGADYTGSGIKVKRVELQFF
jgi:hypothetical protein